VRAFDQFPGLPHAARELGTCFGRLAHLLEIARRLLGGDRLEIGFACIDRRPQHRVSDRQLRLLEATRLDAAA